MLKESLMKLLLATLLLLCLAGPALAHKVNIFAYVDGGIAYSESYFPDGRPVVAGKVLIFDSQEQLLLEGTTDPAGLFQFKLPGGDELTLVIDAGMGHKNQFLLTIAASKE
jgi:nickel transport protein